MIIDTINLNHIRIFECVYRTRSMTKAAEELHMTQSGVSQHIKLLEEILDVQLFDRIKQRLLPTQKAHELFKKSSKGLYDIEQALSDIKGGEKVFSGNVTIGLPTEFGNNVIMPILAKFGKLYPLITFEITYGLASVIENLLLTGKLDFALVDDLSIDKQIHTEKVCDETLHLCCSQEYIEAKSPYKEDKKFFESLDYIEYVKEEPILSMWFKHHLNLSQIRLNVRSTMMDVQGIAKMITEGLGVGILPHHHLQKLEAENKKIHIFQKELVPLKNAISLAYVKDRTQTPVINALIKEIIQGIKK